MTVAAASVIALVDLTNSHADTTLQNQFRLGSAVEGWWRDTQDAIKTQKAKRAKKWPLGGVGENRPLP